MGEFEDKLNSILSSPKDMEKILGLARELSGSLEGEDKKHQEKKSIPDELDPRLLKMIAKLMGEYSGTSNEKTALLAAIRPYVKTERQAALDRALKIAKLTHLAKLALKEFGGDFNFGL